MYTLVYSINNEPNPETVYINLTNACTNSCVFCLREQKDDVCGAQMWHDGNYKLEDIVEQFEKFHSTNQIVKNVVFFQDKGNQIFLMVKSFFTIYCVSLLFFNTICCRLLLNNEN